MARASLQVSLTELPQFRRLVRFVVEVENYARLTADEELAEKVTKLRSDLLAAST